jgi:hypothetical protein
VVAGNKKRPARETLDALRLTLLQVEQNAEPGTDPESLAELKRILLSRIGELEAIQALESASEASTTESLVADIVSQASLTADESSSIVVDPEIPKPPAELD